MTKQQHRRELLLNVAALMAIPVALPAQLAKLSPLRSGSRPNQDPVAAAGNARPRIMTPTGSVKRRA